MAELTVYARTAAPTLVAAGGSGDTFRNDGATELIIINAGPGDIDVTAVAVGRCSHGFLDDEVITVPAGVLWRAGPFSASRFNANGLVSITYEDETLITIAAQKQR